MALLAAHVYTRHALGQAVAETQSENVSILAQWARIRLSDVAYSFRGAQSSPVWIVLSQACNKQNSDLFTQISSAVALDIDVCSLLLSNMPRNDWYRTFLRIKSIQSALCWHICRKPYKHLSKQQQNWFWRQFSKDL